jgi:uncharacterized protein (TIGR03032 family)
VKLDTPFLRLPLRFDADRLAAEVSQFAEAEWRAHPQGHAGNTALPLVAAHGDPADDAARGPMAPTPHLARCPYLRQALAALGTVLGRTRLMRIVGHGEATPHVDTNYYWLHHVRVHVPAVTTPGVRFLCDDDSVHMKPGECWLFDTWRRHNVVNPADASRIHLVADTVGTGDFWELVAGAERPFDPGAPPPRPDRPVRFDPGATPDLQYERVNVPVVMSPWEQECLIADMLDGLGAEANAARAALVRLNRDWRGLWARYGDRADGWPAFRARLDRFQPEVKGWAGVRLPNGVELSEAILQAVVRPALNPDQATDPPPAEPVVVPPSPQATTSAELTFDRPVFIVAAPRSGSTLLFETLARSPDFATVGGEAHAQFEGVPELTPAAHGWESNRLTAADATPAAVAALHAAIKTALRDRDGQPPAGGPVRLLEKTPKNALRIPFLAAAFPGARFVYLTREPRENVSSAIEAWRSGKFVTYPKLPGWGGPPWSLLLVPGWRELNGKPLEEVAAHQWREAHWRIQDDLAQLPRDRWTAVRYEDFLSDPKGTVEKLAAFAGVRWDDPLAGPLPLSRHTLTPPDPDKWRKNAAELERVLPGLRPITDRVRRATAPAEPNAPAEPAALQPLRSVATTTFAPLLARLGVSVAVTTYQAGRLIFLRADGDRMNTHFRPFKMPMGLARRGGRLAVGAGTQVWEFQNQPKAAATVEPAGKHDALFLPRTSHWTGDIRVHDVAYAGDELWVVNTRFSCLCTLDADHSFRPRWRPRFVTALAAEDRCHLNGLAVRDGKPRYVTCLGATDTAGGWRANKRDGGLVLDVADGRVVRDGLSMPHSPRWHDGKLWVLESGEGAVGLLDPGAGKLTTLARLPGFTRGLDFHGGVVFVGLSKVRETAVFSGLPLTDRMPEADRKCGVWAVDARDGRPLAHLTFESGVDEVFAVQVLADLRYPELLTDDDKVIGSSFVLPDDALAEVPAAARR